MVTVEKDVNGISDCICDGNKWHLVYKDVDKEYFFHGTHCGQITGKYLTIELHDTEEEMNNRIEELGIELPSKNNPLEIIQEKNK